MPSSVGAGRTPPPLLLVTSNRANPQHKGTAGKGNDEPFRQRAPRGFDPWQQLGGSSDRYLWDGEDEGVWSGGEPEGQWDVALAMRGRCSEG